MIAPSKTPWLQTNLGASIFGGTIVLILGTLGSAVFEGIPAWWLWVIAAGLLVLGLVLSSLISRTWRRRIWVALGRWIRGLGVLTIRKRAVIWQEGYDAHVDEIANSRRRVDQPAWQFDARDGLGERNLLWLNNRGGRARNVLVTADAELFIPDGEIYWNQIEEAGPLGGYVGAWFKGRLTERGRTEGVMFHLSWVDAAGDPQERDVFFPSEDFRKGRDEALEEEWAKGRAEGRAEVLAELHAMPAIPLPRPRWSVELREEEVVVEPSGVHETFFLINRIERSVAREVRIDPNARYMRLFSAGHWPDLSGEARGEFVGMRSRDGQLFGVPMTVTWYDEQGEQQTEDIEFGPTQGTDAQDDLPF